jgi:hypothetical protein
VRANRSRRVLVVLACAGFVFGSQTGSQAIRVPAAYKPKVRTVCERTVLRHSGGAANLPGATLRKGDRVIIVRYSKRRTLAYVVARNGQGWIQTSALCR